MQVWKRAKFIFGMGSVGSVSTCFVSIAVDVGKAEGLGLHGM